MRRWRSLRLARMRRRPCRRSRELLAKEDPGCRYAAVLALGRIGPTAKSTVPALQKQIGKEPMLAIASVWAIKRHRPCEPSAGEYGPARADEVGDRQG